MNRRSFLTRTLGAVPLYALLAEAGAAQALAAGAVSARRWIAEQQELALALAEGALRPAAWQSEVEALARRVDLAELAAEIARAQTRFTGRALPSYPVKRSLVFLDETGKRRRLRYACALFSFDPDKVITPHAHRHMVSAHLVMEGAFRVRTFDRLRDEEGALIIRPTADEVIGVGAVSTMSTERDNVHWFVPQAERAVTFDVIVSGLDPDAPRYEIQAVDPVRGERLPDGSLRAPILGFEESSRFYTARV